MIARPGDNQFLTTLSRPVGLPLVALAGNDENEFLGCVSPIWRFIIACFTGLDVIAGHDMG